MLILYNVLAAVNYFLCSSRAFCYTDKPINIVFIIVQNQVAPPCELESLERITD